MTIARRIFCCRITSHNQYLPANILTDWYRLNLDLFRGYEQRLQKLKAISVLLPGACRSALKNAVSDHHIKQSIPLCTPSAVHHLIFSNENSHHHLKILILVDCVLCATLRVYYSLFNLLNSCIIELWGRLTNAISILKREECFEDFEINF